jgi:hypothetical protein
VRLLNRLWLRRVISDMAKKGGDGGDEGRGEEGQRSRLSESRTGHFRQARTGQEQDGPTVPQPVPTQLPTTADSQARYDSADAASSSPSGSGVWLAGESKKKVPGFCLSGSGA